MKKFDPRIVVEQNALRDIVVIIAFVIFLLVIAAPACGAPTALPETVSCLRPLAPWQLEDAHNLFYA